MPTPRRRSSRIKSDTTPSHARATPSSKLSSLLERGESPINGPVASIDALISSPVRPDTKITQAGFALSSAMKTPPTASRLCPPLAEMHPSKVHQSTIKSSSSRFALGNTDPQNAPTPTKAIGVISNIETPSKLKRGLPNHLICPSFDFSFERPESDLSTEAQKIMDSVREEAAKIKAQMLEERSKQEDKDGQADQLHGIGGRKINKAKAKAGRYSNIHKQEFKKMDSIVDHVSAWKNKASDDVSSLKRSPSKAGLDQPEKLQKSKSFRLLNDTHERLENTAPGKRIRHHYDDDASAARPVSRDADSNLRISPVKVPTKTGLPSAVTTPTKASLARSASVKSMKTTMIPSLSRSASTKTLRSPEMPKTEGSNKYTASLARFGSMRSILHRSQPKFSGDPVKIAAGTHLPLPQGLIDLEKDLPKLPDMPPGGLHRSPTMKRVGFKLTPNMKPTADLPSSSPSPSKPSIPRIDPQPEVSTSPPINIENVGYPDIAHAANVTSRAKLPRASTPGDFTFRAEKTINFSPSKSGNVGNPPSTIRHVRPSGIPTYVPSIENPPAITHGIPNKKRNRPDPDSETEDGENVDPEKTEDSDMEQPRAKKQRMSASPEKTSIAQSPVKGGAANPAGINFTKSGGRGVKGRKGISLGRLNMLARPKKH